MKILKQLSVAALAAAVLLTGCQNEFTGTDRDTGVLKDINKSAATAGFTVTGVASALTNAKNQEITITFSQPVDIDSVLGAVAFRPVINGADATATTPATVHAYATGVTVTPTILYVNGNAITFQVDLSALTTNSLEVYINADELTARDGTVKMDLDGDNVKGEAIDDDYYTELTVNQSALAGALTVTAVTLGVSRSTNAGYLLNDGAFSIVGAGITSTNTYTTTLAIAAGDTTDYKALLDAAIAIEQYVPRNNSMGSWTAVAKTGSTYTAATGAYVATIAATTEGTVLRVRVATPETLVTTPLIRGFNQNFYSGDTDYRDARVEEDILVDPAKVSVTAAQYPKEIPEVDQDTVTVTAVFDTNGLNGKVYIDVPLALAGTRGVDAATATRSNIRLVSETSSGSGKYTLINYSGNPQCVATSAAYPTAITRIILTLPADYKNAGGDFWLNVTSGLATLGDETGTAVWARHFGDYDYIDSIPEFIGTYFIDADSGTL